MSVSWVAKVYVSCCLFSFFLSVAIFMGVDMFGRLDKVLSRSAAGGSKKNL